MELVCFRQTHFMVVALKGYEYDSSSTVNVWYNGPKEFCVKDTVVVIKGDRARWCNFNDFNIFVLYICGGVVQFQAPGVAWLTWEGIRQLDWSESSLM